MSERLAEAGHTVAVIHRGGDERLNHGILTASYASDRSATWIGQFEPDVIHAHGDVLADLEPLAPEGCPIVHSFHDFGFACASGSKYFRDGTSRTRAHGPGCFAALASKGCAHRIDPRPFVRSYFAISHKLRNTRRERVIFHSEYMRSVGITNGIAPDRSHVVPLFVDRPDARPGPTPNRSVAFAGRIVRDKGLDVLLDALALCPYAWDELVVAGDGWDRSRCEQIARKHRFESKVRFVGEIGVQTVRELFARARVVVVPSRWPEPFGMVGLEAMAEARAVIASDVGGISEWLTDGETGLLVPPSDARALANALEALLSDPPRAERMGKEGWRKVERFSADAHLSRLLAVYEATIAAVTNRPVRAEAQA